MKNKLIIMGFNNNNLGDDLMFASIINHSDYASYYFYGPQITPYFIDKPIRFIKYGRALPFRWKFFADFALIGGSVVMGKSESHLKMLAEKNNFFSLNKVFGGSNYIVGANLGPFNEKSEYILQLKKLDKRVDKWLVRDTYSADLLAEAGSTTFNKMPDMVMGFDVTPYIRDKADKMISISVTEVNKDGMGLIDRDLYLQEIVQWIEHYANKGYVINLLSFENVIDLKVIETIRSMVSGQYCNAVNVIPYRGDSVIKCMAQSELIISTRFHCMVLGALLNKQQIIYSYSLKTDNFSRDYGFDVHPVDGCIDGKSSCPTRFSAEDIELAKSYPKMMSKR
jgi:polysaccharide pyruvyl transferase WcaK-like protein